MDYNVPGGTDKEGWQYAADFPVYVTIISQDIKKKENKVAIFLTDLPLSGRFMATKP